MARQSKKRSMHTPDEFYSVYPDYSSKEGEARSKKRLRSDSDPTSLVTKIHRFPLDTRSERRQHILFEKVKAAVPFGPYYEGIIKVLQQGNLQVLQPSTSIPSFVKKNFGGGLDFAHWPHFINEVSMHAKKDKDVHMRANYPHKSMITSSNFPNYS